MKYSEFDEEDFLLDYFKEATGTFVDIGANNGWKGSNTRALFERGWGGVCVEADPGTFKNLCKTYEGQDRVKCVHAAAWHGELGLIPFYSHSVVVDSGLSSLFHGKQDTTTEYSVRATTLDAILEETSTTKIDFLSIDAEGCDYDILLNYSFEVRPKLVMVEHSQSHSQFEELMTKHGYVEVFRNQSNMAFADERKT